MHKVHSKKKDIKYQKKIKTLSIAITLIKKDVEMKIIMTL